MRLPVYSVHPGASPCSADSQVVGESERSREQILQTLSDLSRGFQDIADRCLLVLHLEVRYAEHIETHPHFTDILEMKLLPGVLYGFVTFHLLCSPDELRFSGRTILNAPKVNVETMLIRNLLFVEKLLI